MPSFTFKKSRTRTWYWYIISTLIRKTCNNRPIVYVTGWNARFTFIFNFHSVLLIIIGGTLFSELLPSVFETKQYNFQNVDKSETRAAVGQHQFAANYGTRWGVWSISCWWHVFSEIMVANYCENTIIPQFTVVQIKNGAADNFTFL